MDAIQLPLAVRYGGHRVLSPAGALPQAAERLDADPDLLDEAGRPRQDEIVLDVERLNVDSASFRQLEDAAQKAGEDPAAGVQRRVLEIVAARGKLHNPVTGSGGMLLGRVRRVGTLLPPPHAGLRPGDRVATLVSLTLTPLRIGQAHEVRLAQHQLVVSGTAVLFASGAWARLPDFLPESVALAALDVAGAGPQVARMVQRLGPGARVLVLGCGGKSGLLCAVAARRAGAAHVAGVEAHAGMAQDARALGAFDAVLEGDARDALVVAQRATAAGGPYDLVVSCVNTEGAEMAAILCARDRGLVYFFSMATSFTRAALGAEGVSQDVDMLVGNGYCHGHAEETLRILREEAALRDLFIARYR